MLTTTRDIVLEALGAEDDGRVCKDIPDAACAEEPRNRLVHLVSLSATKLADGLIDPKLVLSWLITALGAPAALAGLLVPVREAGALLPQLVTAPRIRAMPRRKLAWAAGSLVQGLCALAIVVIALTLEGALAGWLIVGALAVLALARSVCSVSYKDVLGKTVSKSRRGKTTGLAGSLSAVGVILFSGILLAFGASIGLLVPAIALAGVLWIAAAALFTRLEEVPGATEGGGSGLKQALSSLSLLSTDAPFRRFVVTRGLLISTALAPPFLVALTPGISQGLGALLLGSAAAGLVSSWVWGRLADRSSRKVLALSGALSALVLATAALFGTGFGVTAMALTIFAAQIAYQGVRLGRSTHLVDMGTPDTRAAYTAVSNTVIGLLLLAGSLYAALASALGTPVVIGLMALQSGLGAMSALRLEEVQGS